MDRKGILGVTLTIIAMFAWSVYVAKTTPPPKPADATSAQTPVVGGAAGTTGTASPTAAPSTAATGTATPEAPAVTEPQVPEQTQKKSTPALEYTFTNHGGGISRAELLKHLEHGQGIVLNQYGTVPVGAVSEQPGADADVSYTAGTDAQGAVTYERTTAQQIVVKKKFTLPTAADGKEQYVATLDLSYTNAGDKHYKSPGYYVYLGSAAPLQEHELVMYTGLDWYKDGKATDINVMWFNSSSIPIIGSAGHLYYEQSTENVGWAAVFNQYYTNIVTPLGDGEAARKATRVWARRIPLDVNSGLSGDAWVKNNPAGATPRWYAIDGAVGMPGFDLEPGKTYTQQFRIYLGPRQYQLLSQFDTGEGANVRLGYFGFVGKFLLTMMTLLQKYVGSYAVAIIVLTLLIKLAMWPLQNRATQSMKKMQALSPKMNELRDKYKDDPARMNQETIKLYKTYGVNPLSGCLPMFIQLPIFIGFYTMLGSAIELRNSQFFWVHDLSQPDTVGHLPILGWAINVLPLCMAATNVWMMSITPKSGDATQQKMMMFMPLIFLWICYSYASGLALYMMVSNLFSVAQLYLTRNQSAPTLEKITAAMAVKNGKKKR